MGKCFKKGCESATEEGSNYCLAHLPGQVVAKKVLKSEESWSPVDGGFENADAEPGGCPAPDEERE